MKYLKFLASIKTTVACLLWLSVLTFWGTLYQAEHGLYRAQELFFSSWFLYYVLPGGSLVMIILFLNLSVSLFYHYQAGWKMPGLLLIHLGLILMLAGGFVTKLTGFEAQISLLEGAGTNVATSREKWEISFWEYPDAVRDVTAVDVDDLRKSGTFALPDMGMSFEVLDLHRNAEPRVMKNPVAPEALPMAAQNIHAFEPKGLELDPAHNLPGVILRTEGVTNATEILLYGTDPKPLLLQRNDGRTCFVALRRKKVEVPLFLELIDFRREYYPGSEIPKDYRSLITVRFGEDQARDVTIKMNEPFRYQGWTFYQQSFAVQGDSERSVFAVTKNYGRLIPYVATGVTSVGLFAHFFQMQWMAIMRRKRKAAKA